MSDLIYFRRERGGQAARLAQGRDQDSALLSSGRIFYRLDPDAVVIAGVTKKTTQKTPRTVLEACKRRLAQFDRDVEDWKQ